MVPERSFKASQLKVHSSGIEQSRSIVKPTTLRARAGLYALAFWLIAVYKQLEVTWRRLISRTSDHEEVPLNIGCVPCST